MLAVLTLITTYRIPETEGIQSVIESHQLTPHAFNKGNCLRVTFDMPVAKQDNATDHRRLLCWAWRATRRQEKKARPGNGRQTAQNTKKFLSENCEVVWSLEGAKGQNNCPRLQRWLQGQNQNYDVHLHTCRRLIHDVLKLPEWGQVR